VEARLELTAGGPGGVTHVRRPVTITGPRHR
jgi:hypothetical protein